MIEHQPFVTLKQYDQKGRVLLNPLMLQITLASYLLMFAPGFTGTVLAQKNDAKALYGEIAVVKESDEQKYKTGHDALGSLTQKMQGYYRFKDQLRDNYGFEYILEYAPQFQWDWKLNGTDHANDETNIIVQWSPFDHADSKRGSLTGWYQISRTLGSLNTSEFMDETGVISPLNGGDTAPDDSRDLIQMLAWEQWFLSNNLRMGFGKLTTRTFLNLNRYATGDREDFFSPMLVNNPVAPFTARNGLGMFGQYHFDEAYLIAMGREADGTTSGIDFTNLEKGKWEYALEAGLTPVDLIGLGEGYYRFTGYYTDSIGENATYQPSGWAVALSFDQDVGENYGALLRYSYASEDYRAYKQRLALGMQLKAPLQYKNDRIGVGAWWGDPISQTADDEYGLETYWKVQLAPYLELSPNLQILLSPQGETDRDVVFIGGLRLRIVL